jgi:hypothetical protein
MARASKLIVGGLSLFSLGVGSAIWLGAARWNNKTAQLIRKLLRTGIGNGNKTVTFKGFESLPVPVVRYFRRTLTEGQPIIRSARIAQSGEFRRAKDAWSPFEATQHFSAEPPGFVWDATVRMSSPMRVRVRDAYVGGDGTMQAKLLSLVPLVDQSDRLELNSGALQRYLAEAVWIPTALLPGQGVKWSAIDDTRALATLTDSGTAVSLEFDFNNAGEITGVFTPGRYREVDGKYELTPWQGHFRNYKERDGMRYHSRQRSSGNCETAPSLTGRGESLRSCTQRQAMFGNAQHLQEPGYAQPRDTGVVRSDAGLYGRSVLKCFRGTVLILVTVGGRSPC